jgi:DNA-binding ferritin-like protein
MQFLYHNFHNLASGPSFFSDHAFFGDSYSAIESNYDSVIEIVIGDGNIPDLKLLHFNAVKIMAELNSEDNFFNSGLVAEKTLQSLIESISKENIDQGTTNLIGAIAESSKTRTYKIKQRIA